MLNQHLTARLYLYGQPDNAEAGGGWTDYFQIKALNATEFDIKWNVSKSGGRMGYLVTTRKFRDPAAWYHFVFVWDTGNSTSGDRMRLYVNGVRETSFSSETVPTLNEPIIIYECLVVRIR